jgi:ligand-binding SRPBCC domain-containing protein
VSVRNFRNRLRVDRPIDEVFAFFERPENLERITPPWMGMRILSSDHVMRLGLEIDYAITPLPHVPARWRSRITAYDPPHFFTDVQLRGPYARWEHSHRFSPDGDATIVEDDVTYALPFGLLGDLVGPVLVRPRLRSIFDYRSAAIRRLLPDRAASAADSTVVQNPGIKPRAPLAPPTP